MQAAAAALAAQLRRQHGCAALEQARRQMAVLVDADHDCLTGMPECSSLFQIAAVSVSRRPPVQLLRLRAQLVITIYCTELLELTVANPQI